MSHITHRVVFFALDANGALVWDLDDQAVVKDVVEFSDIAEAQAVYRDSVRDNGLSSASLSVDVRAFADDDLAGYLHALNTDARACEEFPKEGSWVGSLTENLTHWAGMGVTTPTHLAAYLDGCFERELEKAAMG